MRKEVKELTQLNYRDIWIRTLLSLFAAHFIVVYGDGAQVSDIIKHFDYYNALIASFTIAFLVLYYLWLITTYLDEKLDWYKSTIKRIMAQIGLGVIPPALIAAGLATVYFRMYGHNILETEYFSADFPVIVLLIFIANLYYFIFYMVRNFWPGKGEPIINNATDTVPGILKTGIELADEKNLEVEDTKKEINDYREIYIVNTATKSIPIKATEIAYFYRANGCNFLRTFTGEDFPISEGLKDIEAQFNPNLFFRINRQIIVNFEACSSFGNGDREGTIIIQLSPPLIIDREQKNKAMATVSEERIRSFKTWLAR